MKKFLLATAAVLASTSAYAADYAVVHPFYTPTKGKFISTTAFDYEHSFSRAKDWDMKETDFEKTFTETVKFGVTEEVQVGLSASRGWGRDKDKIPGLIGNVKGIENDWKFDIGYNVINDGKAFLNVDLAYSQEVIKFSPRREEMGVAIGNDHNKYIDLTVLGGYNFDDVTVFGSVNYNRQVDSIKWQEKDKIWTLEAGAYKAFNDQISARASLSAEIDKTKDSEERTYWLNAGVDYSISKKMAVSAKASYMLDNDVDDHPLFDVDTHSAYKLGVDFKIEFLCKIRF